MMRNSVFNIAAIVAALCCIVLMASCGTKKNVPATPYEPADITGEPGDAFTSLAASYKPWTDVSMPVRVELKEPKNLGISGKAAMVHGKSVYLSLRFLGMELGAVYVDTDSIYVVSKMQKLAYVESLDFFRRSFGFSLDDIQSLLLGQVFVPGKGTVTEKEANNFSITAGDSSDTWILTPKKTPSKVTWHFEGCMSRTADAMTSIVESLIVSPASMKPLSAGFKSHTDTQGGIAASQVSLAATMSKHSLRLDITWSLNRAEWNKGIAPAVPKVPSNYRRITTAGLLEMLKKL